MTAPRQILTIEAKRVCPALHTGCRSLPLATVAAELVGTSSWKGMYLYLFPSLNCSHSISGKNVRRIGRSDQDAGKPSCPAVSAADISACSEEDTRRCISFISHLFSCTRGASTTLRWSIVTRQNGCTTLHHPDIVFEDPSFGCALRHRRSVVGLLLVWIFRYLDYK